MLEIGIVICLVVVLFFVLRHFSDKDGNNEEEGKKMASFWQRFGAKDGGNKSSIEAEIIKGQEKIVSPAEINKAKQGYSEADPEVAHVLLKADDAFEQNDLRSAEDFAIEAISKEKKCAQAYVIMGKIACVKNSTADAKECFKTALKCNPGTGEAYFGLGQMSLKEENYSEAIELLQTATSCDRGNAAWFAELGRAYLGVRQFAKAAKAFKKASNLEIDNKEYKDLANDTEAKIRVHSSLYRNK